MAYSCDQCIQTFGSRNQLWNYTATHDKTFCGKIMLLCKMKAYMNKDLEYGYDKCSNVVQMLKLTWIGIRRNVLQKRK